MHLLRDLINKRWKYRFVYIKVDFQNNFGGIGRCSLKCKQITMCTQLQAGILCIAKGGSSSEMRTRKLVTGTMVKPVGYDVHSDIRTLVCS